MLADDNYAIGKEGAAFKEKILKTIEEEENLNMV